MNRESENRDKRQLHELVRLMQIIYWRNTLTRIDILVVVRDKLVEV